MRPSTFRRLVPVAATIALGLTAVALGPNAGGDVAHAAPVQQARQAAAWTVAPARSSLQFRATATGTAFTGRITDWTAAIRFDPANLAGSSVNVDVNIASIRTGDAQRDQFLPTPDWMDAGRHPRARFTSNQIRSLGGNRYEAVGNLTIRGVSRPLTLPFTVTINGANAVAQGSIGLNRNAFGVGQGQWASEETVGRVVTVSFTINATRG